MLKGIDNRLNAEVLGVLRAMGHGDVLILADTNFPSDSVARATVTGQLLRMDNLTSAEAAEAILSVLPLDTFVPDFAGRMEVVGAPLEIPPVQAEVQAAINPSAKALVPVGIQRHQINIRHMGADDASRGGLINTDQPVQKRHLNRTFLVSHKKG